MPFPAYTPNMRKLGEAWCLNVFHHITEGTWSLDSVKFVSKLTFEQGDCLVGPEQLTASFLNSVKKAEAYAPHGVCRGYRPAFLELILSFQLFWGCWFQV